jgi:hypothetical protein
MNTLPMQASQLAGVVALKFMLCRMAAWTNEHLSDDCFETHILYFSNQLVWWLNINILIIYACLWVCCIFAQLKF